MKQKRWFHATTKDNWKKIKKTGYLKRGTFLARNLEELIRMINLPLIGDLRKCELVLSVRYCPNTYNPKDWEIVTDKRILIDNIKLHSYLPLNSFTV